MLGGGGIGGTGASGDDGFGVYADALDGRVALVHGGFGASGNRDDIYAISLTSGEARAVTAIPMPPPPADQTQDQDTAPSTKAKGSGSGSGEAIKGAKGAKDAKDAKDAPPSTPDATSAVTSAVTSVATRPSRRSGHTLTTLAHPSRSYAVLFGGHGKTGFTNPASGAEMDGSLDDVSRVKVPPPSPCLPACLR